MNKLTDMAKRKTFWVGVLAILAGIVDIAFGDSGAGWSKIIAGGGLVTGSAEFGHTVNQNTTIVNPPRNLN